MQTFVSGTALVTGASGTNYPAPLAILSSVFEGTQVAIDVGLRIESKYFGKLLAGPVARNLMRTLFVSKGSADKLAARPVNIPKLKISKVGVIGAPSARADIVSMNAKAGIQVIQLNGASESERGSDLAGAQLAIESNADLDARLIRQIEDMIPHNCLLATTRLTPPISTLARSLTRPDNFIGVHFAHPLTQSTLVEVIKAPQTSDESLARTLDYMVQLRKTPIIVGDFPGFFVNRILETYLREGQKMLEDGVAAALVENAAKAAGFSLGPLALSDDVTIPGRMVIDRMIELQRPGGDAGGFYDHGANGQRRLWSDLSKAFPTAALQPELTDLRLRFLTIMALESARCLEQGVIHDPAAGDLGSVLGAGYPSWTGGTLSYIDTIGVSQFIRDCRRLDDRWGPRFKPTEWLIEREELDRRFYGVSHEPVRAQAG
jgi:3-hydroxyacyl-CoA dehydrogenase/enoyl-CoA hydratase/3-hydroxybutyryl-CoA epimerase